MERYEVKTSGAKSFKGEQAAAKGRLNQRNMSTVRRLLTS